MDVRKATAFFLLDYGFCSSISKGGRAKNKKKIKERIAYKTSPTSAMFPISMRAVTLRGHA